MATTTQSLAAQIPTLLASRDRRGFVRVVTQLLDLRAPLTSGWKSLSLPLLDFGELDLARRAIDRFAEADGRPGAQYDRALTYVRCARPQEAVAILRDIDRRVPDPASNAYLRGTIALNLGEHDVARSALLDAHAARPGSGQVLQTLSMLGSLHADPDVAALIMEAAVAMRSAPAVERGSYLYALGKTHDDLGDTDAAFAAFDEGASIIAAQRRYDADWDRANAADAVAGWTRERVEAIGARVAIDTGRPIIVTGLPRSGSTLVEQVLTSHSAVADGDELGRFAIVANEIGGARFADYEAWARRHSAEQASRTYLHLIAQRFGGQGRVVDKTLEASRYLGLLAAVMPDAPILWMRRDPIDNAWSCFSTYFIDGLAWTWSQQAVAAHMKQEDKLLRIWQDMLGDRLKIVDYEALVADKERVIPRILADAGLAMEPATLTPETNVRLVTTASVAQVRAPINDRAVGRARRYVSYLQPFVDAYGYAG